MFATPTLPQTRFDPLILSGGLDLITPTLSTPPGMAKGAINFEVSPTGGYSRLTGYERYDGRRSPSDALVQQLKVVALVVTPMPGDTVTGATSGSTGVVIDTTVEGIVAITRSTGAFQRDEILMRGTDEVGVIERLGGTQGSQLDAILQAKAADIYRTDIQGVPGSGPVRGVVFYRDELYAFRDNADGTLVAIYRATTSGWVLAPFSQQVAFTNGGTTLVDGAVITQGANSATIRRVVVESGNPSANTAKGRLVITTPTQGAFVAGAATVSPGAGTVTLSGAATTVGLKPGGRFEFVIDNFTGADATRRVYGCDGVNPAFEFDGSLLTPISTGSLPDTPKHIAVFMDHLFLAIESSIVHSAPGDPFDFTALNGAGEMAMGDNVTGLSVARGVQAGGSLVVYGRNATNIVYGSNATDWQKVPYGEGSGCIRYSVAYLNEPYCLDDRGLLTLKITQSYGNFDQATLTSNIQPFINSKRTRVAAAIVNRSKSQYRLFFNDGSGLFATILNGKYLGAIPVEFPHTVFCAWNGETSGGDEVSFFGATDGKVYQLERGTSFDGQPLVASFNLTFNHTKSPRILKTYLHAALEVTGGGYARIDFGYQLGYGSQLIPQPNPQTYDTAFAAVFWDSFTWDAFIWDGVTLAPTEAELRGDAENLSIAIASGTNYIAAYTINSIIIHYMMRRTLR